MNVKYKESEFNIPFQCKDGKYGYYNTYSGSYIKLDNPIQSYYTNYTPAKEFNKLLELGFFVPEKQDEIAKFSIERKKAQFTATKSRAHFVIAVTMNCQAKCVYCFQHGVDRNITMKTETAEGVIDFIKNEVNTTNTKNVWLTFFGGEPLLALPIIIQLGETLKKYYEEKNITFYSDIITNGIGLTLETAKELKEKVNLIRAQITLDGTKEIYNQMKQIDAYDIVINNIRQICKIVKVVIRLNITKDNMDNIEELIDCIATDQLINEDVTITFGRVTDFHGCDYDGEKCLPFDEFGQFISMIYKKYGKCAWLDSDQLLPTMHRTFCGMENCAACTIGPEGELYKCEHYFGRKEEIIGTVWEGRYYNSAEITFYNDIDKKCINNRCALLPTCVGGCQSEYVKFGVPTDCEERMRKVIDQLSTYNSIY